MSINFEYYKIFYYVAKYKNITRAAAALGSNQPNVTRIMKLLEAELNCKLFVREARGITLTEEGERLYTHVEIAVMQLQNAQEELSAQTSDEIGTVDIGATETALHLFLLNALHSFKEDHPRVRIKIHNHTTPEILQQLAYGRLDFAVLTTPFTLQKSFVSSDLITFYEILAAGRQYQQLRQRTWTIRELRQYPWVGLGNGTATYEYYKKYLLQHHADIELDMEAASSDLLIPLIKNNFGIGFIPEMMARPLLKEQVLVQIPLNCKLPERRLCLVYDKGRGRSVVSRELQKYLKSVPDMFEAACLAEAIPAASNTDAGWSQSHPGIAAIKQSR